MGKPASRVEAVLYELCVEYGYCLPNDELATILSNVPEDADEFLDAVLMAEGNRPDLMDKSVRSELREVVRDWLFDDGLGRGTRSGLPRLRPMT
jgi:hypothetical protein